DPDADRTEAVREALGAPAAATLRRIVAVPDDDIVVGPTGKVRKFLMRQRHLAGVGTPVWIAVGLAQPVVYLLLFAPMLKKALVATGGPATYAYAYKVYVPGLLVAIAGFGGL